VGAAVQKETVVETDVLVIGGGIAGCFAAMNARDKGVDVVLVDKASPAKSGGTSAAGAGYMIFDPESGHDLQTTLDAIARNGEYLSDRDWAEIILRDSLGTFEDLVSWGVDFPAVGGTVGDQYQPLDMKDPSGMRSMFGQVFIRRGNFRVLAKRLITRGVKTVPQVMITDLLTSERGVVGAIGFSSLDERLYVFKAKATIVSTGAGSFKPVGSGISCLTGDGIAMAYRAGAGVTGKEFPSKFVTLAAYPQWRSYGGFVGYPRFTDAEGESVELRNIDNVGFWDLAMENAIHSGKGPIFWNLEAATDKDIESILEAVRLSEGSDVMITRTGVAKPGVKIELAGGAGAGSSDSMTSGVWPVDTSCATVVPGLFVAGECCGTRYVGSVHTARGFGLTGSAVTGARAGRGAADFALAARPVSVSDAELAEHRRVVWSPTDRAGGFAPAWVTQLLQNAMLPYFVLSIKHEKRLQAALTTVEFLRDHLVPRLMAKDGHELRLAHETRNMVLNAEMILKASLFRTESRGQHYREDHPYRDDPFWLAWVKLEQQSGEMRAVRVPVPEKWWPDLNTPYEGRYPQRFLLEQV
jgi:succinate dehydrogenase/fumarate reductase flavoprotein subunit